MMYYRINNSCDPKVIGNVNSQADHALFDVDIKDPNLSRNIFLKKIDNVETVITITPILVKKAKLTDLINGSANGLGGIQLMISNRFKEILSYQNHHGLQFFPMSIIYKDTKLDNYWLTNPYEFDMAAIDYSKSLVEIQGLGNQPLREIKIDNLTHFEEVQSTLKLPERVFIKTVALSKNLTKDLIILRWVSGGIGYYVSDSLKQQIEDAGCTGIDFEVVGEN